jgi:glutamate synthase domain-containing protein 2
LGDRFAEKPLELDIPIFIGAMSFGAISKEAKMALAKGASEVGTAVNTGEGGLLPEESKLAKKTHRPICLGKIRGFGKIFAER